MSSPIMPSVFASYSEFISNYTDCYKGLNSSYNEDTFKGLGLHTKYPSKSGLNLNDFFLSSIIYNHKKNLKNSSLKYINRLCRLNYNPDGDIAQPFNNTDFYELGYIEHYNTVIATKFLYQGKVFLIIEPYTVPYGNFISMKTSSMINRIERFCKENNISFIINKKDNDKTKNFEKINEEKECSICLIKSNNDIVKTPCGHFFNRECLKTWFSQNKKSCPLCRTVIVP